ncbi:hypothetical protein C475_16426 [Halosimplex carlsbadense 2-9-1]|uniref:Archaeal Type IV pilin N-terminal domain-containing protein n=1 Tax=Halosimplex carlsbadense 2-9-1 TaxID=797114 RepID=M0CHD4_9EURY|nr:hypothetical protein C475_16426 [Halosimplex carlsbadense 2-9-1]
MIGTVLLVAIAVLLASVAAYVAFGATEEREPAPEVTLELEPGPVPGAYELSVTNGERLDGERVELRGAADENALRNRDLLAGDSAAVFPVRERLQLVWFGEHDSSYVLREFEVDPEVPSADETCPWLAGKTSVSIDFVLYCDVSITDSVDIESGGTVVGRIESQSDSVDIDTGLTVYGPVTAGDDVAIDGSEVAGDVRGPDVDIDTTTVYGSVKSANEVDLDGATVTGHVYAPSVSCTDNPTIDGQSCSSYAPKDPDDY